jgi:hypothetical protein
MQKEEGHKFSLKTQEQAFAWLKIFAEGKQ